jgi:hypothetical protein
MNTSESYYRRVWRRFRKDAVPWARDNIVWGIVVLAVPLLVVYIRKPTAPIEWDIIKATIWLYAIALVAYALLHLCLVPAKLDADREEAEKELRAVIAERDRTIRESTAQRTQAEQYHYDKAKAFLQKFGPSFVIALRHLKTHKRLTFGTYPPVLPHGMPPQEFQRICITCLCEGLVCKGEKVGSGEQTFEIAPTMEWVLDDLLYDSQLFPD